MLGFPNFNDGRRWDVNVKRLVTLLVAASLGGGVSLVVGSCGGDDRGGVEVEGSTSGAETSTAETTTAP